MRKAVFTLLLAAMVAIIVSATGGAANQPKPKSQDQAKAWFNAQPAVQAPSSVQADPASPADAAAAAAMPGAQVEGSASAVNPNSATKGMTIAPNDAEGGGGSVCWQAPWNLTHNWGTLIYSRNVYEYRYWCASWLGGPQSYRVSYVDGSSTSCNVSNRALYKFSGGNGYTWTTVETSAHFSCPTPWWFPLQSTDWQRWSCNTWGNCALVDSGER